MKTARNVGNEAPQHSSDASTPRALLGPEAGGAQADRATRRRARALRLRQVRAALEGNQSAAARRLGISQTAWNHYERGARDIDVDVLESSCRTFGVSADWVLLGDLMALDKRLIAKMVRAHPELADGAAPPMLPLDAEPPSGRR